MADITVAQLRGDPDQRKTCFVAAPIGKEGSPERERSDIVLQYVIAATLEPMGYTVNRGDQLAESGSITTQIISHLVNSDMAVFDLAGNNANVFYELALRHAANKPYVQLNDGSTIPFDVAGYRTLAVNHQHIPSVEQAKRDLAAMVHAFEDGAPVETPLTPVPDLDVLLAAGNPVRNEACDNLAQRQADIGRTRGRPTRDKSDQRCRRPSAHRLLYV